MDQETRREFERLDTELLRMRTSLHDVRDKLTMISAQMYFLQQERTDWRGWIAAGVMAAGSLAIQIWIKK